MQLACSPAVQKSAFYEPLHVSRVMDCSLHLTLGAGRGSSQKQLRKLMIRWSEIPKLSVWETSIKCVSHSAIVLLLEVGRAQAPEIISF